MTKKHDKPTRPDRTGTHKTPHVQAMSAWPIRERLKPAPRHGGYGVRDFASVDMIDHGIAAHARFARGSQVNRQGIFLLSQIRKGAPTNERFYR